MGLLSLESTPLLLVVLVLVGRRGRGEDPPSECGGSLVSAAASHLSKRISHTHTTAGNSNNSGTLAVAEPTAASTV